MDKDTFIEALLTELSYRSNQGYPDFNDPEHITLLSEILDEWGVSELKNELINNLISEAPEKPETHFENPILNKEVEYEDADGNTKTGIVGNLLRQPKDTPPRDAADKALQGISDEERDEINRELGSEKDGDTDPDKDFGGKDDEESDGEGGEQGQEEPEMGTSLNPDSQAGQNYIDSLPDGDPAKKSQEKSKGKKLYPVGNGYYSDTPDGKAKYKRTDEVMLREETIKGVTPKGNEITVEPIDDNDGEEEGSTVKAGLDIFAMEGNVFGGEETGDVNVKNDMLKYGYNGYEKEVGSKPAPGGAGSAFNEIISGEGIHVLNRIPDISEDELAQVLFKNFSDTELGREQSKTAGIEISPELTTKRTNAVGSGTLKNPDFPDELKKAEQEVATYTKCLISARSAKKKFEVTQQRVKRLQKDNKLGEDTETLTFYGADESLNAQKEVIGQANKIYLPNGDEVTKEDAQIFIDEGGGGMNPSDTATFVKDKDDNILIQFHSDKTTTKDIQDNSTLRQEATNYLNTLDELNLPDAVESEANKIIKEIDKEIEQTEDDYNDQSKNIAKNLSDIPFDEIESIIKNDTGTLMKNLDVALYGSTRYKSGDFSEFTTGIEDYAPDGVSPEDMTLEQKWETIRAVVADGKSTNSVVKPINKVALQYKSNNPDARGLAIKEILSDERKKVVNLQRERVDKLNNFQVDVSGTSIPLGTYMEAKEAIRGFHLTLMDYPPKSYTKGDPSSMIGSSLDVNMGGVRVTGEIMKGCLGVNNTVDFLKNFKLEKEERYTTDNAGNVTGKNVFVYTVDKEGNKTELGQKTYRSKQGATGKTSNTMQYSSQIQECFKKNQ